MTIFFFHSGGGVTISGGEVFLQADFAQKILKSCIEQRIKENMIRLNKEFKEKNLEKVLTYSADLWYKCLVSITQTST